MQQLCLPDPAPSEGQETAILRDLSDMTYEAVAAKWGWSRGRIYALALRRGARKTEARISERARERRQRQAETLAQLIDETATADVLDYLDSLTDEAAQIIVTSIPYNLGVRYGDRPGADTMRHVYFVGWLMQIVSECSRILKPGGILFLQVGSTRDETGSLIPLDVVLFDALRKTGLEFNSRVAWIQPHGLTPQRRLAERYETALVFSKGPASVFHPTPARTPQAQPTKRAFKGPRKGELSGNPLGAFPSNVWTIPSVRHGSVDKTAHPAQFPIDLARRAIQIWTNPGDLVLDPFSGSGTTHAAARETHRRFSGCDLFYGDIRAERLRRVVPDLVSALPGVTEESLAVWQAEARRKDSEPKETGPLC